MKPRGRPRGPNYRLRNVGAGQARGERMGNAVLTEKLVRRIKELRRDYRLGSESICELLLEEEGVVVSEGAVRDVIDGRTWKHVTCVT